MRILFFVFILFSLNAFSQDNDITVCNEIYGKWQTYYVQMPFGIDSKDKSETWVFNEDGTLIIEGKRYTYTLDDDCTKLYIGDNENYYSITIHEGNYLYIVRKILPHESYVLRFKKIDKK